MSSTIQAISNAAQSPAAVQGVKGPQKVQRPEAEAQDRSPKPVTDEYVPEKKREPAGLYWLEKGEDGQPKVCFDDPERMTGAPANQDERPNADSPDRKVSGKKAETCTGSTDKVDREIEKLKKKREELVRQINSETDKAKIKELEQKLSQVERELSQKDNDAYRRQHTVFS